MAEHDDLERLLGDAFDARARSAVPDGRSVPPFPDAPAGVGRHRNAGRARRHTWLAPVAAAAAVLLAALVVAVLNRDDRGTRVAAGPSSTSARTTNPATAPLTSAESTGGGVQSSQVVGGPTKPVQVTSLESDGATYGVGMPIILYFSPMPTDAKAFTDAVQVTVDGRPANGAWYWEQATATEVKKKAVEAHYRMQKYWPANSKIHVSFPIEGLSAGKGLAYAGKLTSLDFNIGDAHVSTVDGSSGVLDMHVTSNGKEVKTLPVSLGSASTPTYNGTKVVMQKGENIPGSDQLRKDGTVLMSGPGYSNDPVRWSVRITQSGEYVHAAPWNQAIGQRSTSNGCTNLQTADAKWFYEFSQIGDIVNYSNTGGGHMPSWDGLGDWDLPWAVWKQGGLFKTH